MDEAITICTVSYNARYMLAAMWESYRKFNPDFPARLMVMDNGSVDGALDYATRHADLVLLGHNARNHGVCLTEVARRVQTPYLLVSDNDILWKRPGGMRKMMEHMGPKTWVVCPNRSGVAKGEMIAPLHRIAYSPGIYVGLFRTEVFQTICRELDLGYYGEFNTGTVYETGGLAWLVARTHGLDSVELPELWDYVRHYGGVSRLWCHMPNYPSMAGANPNLEPAVRVSYIEQYDGVKRDLANVRGCGMDDLDAHEPAPTARAVVEDTGWKLVPASDFHQFLLPGAGTR